MPAVPGIVVGAGPFLTEALALALPVLARQDVALLDLDGPLLASTPFRVAGGVISLWLVGLVIAGVAVEWARVLPRGIGMLLAVATAQTAAFAVASVPVAGKIAALIFSGAHAWLGWSMTTSVLPREQRAGNAQWIDRPTPEVFSFVADQTNVPLASNVERGACVS